MLTREQLDALGLTGIDFGQVEFVARPEPTAGQALGRRDAIALSLVALLQHEIQPPLGASLLPLRERGATLAFLAENPDFVRIRTVSGEGTLSVKGPSEGVVEFADDPGTVFWDTVKQPRLVLALPAGFAALERANGGVSVQFDGPSVAVPALAILDAPLADWASRVIDAWSAAELIKLAAIRSRWSVVIGAGLLGRLFESPSADEAAQSARRVVRIDPDEPAVWPRLWARSLTDAQCRTVTDLGFAEMDTVHQMLDDLDADNDLKPSHWGVDWTDVCHRRDNLACAVFVLHEARSADVRLRDALGDLDSRGKATLFSIPHHAVDDDERMRRIRATEPLAWWGSPADIGPLL